MQILETILYIVLFIVFLSTLIIVHELGHLAAAKAFNVYCLEYSVGMGPLIFKYKRKGGETQFSLRGIPFGGYVSMYGEGIQLPDGVEVPESRSLHGIKWWKRAIILVAGVTMNAFLAITMFFISNCIPQQDITFINQVAVKGNSEAYSAGLRSEDIIKFDEWYFYDDVSNIQRTYYLADSQTTFKNADATKKYATCYNFSSLSSYKHLDLSEFTYMYEMIPVHNMGEAYEVTYSDGNVVRFLVKDFNHRGQELTENDYRKSSNGVWFIFNVDTHITDIYSANKEDVSVVSVKRVEDEYIPSFYSYSNDDFDEATIHLTKRVKNNEGKRVDGETVTLTIKQKQGTISSYGLSLYLKTTQLNAGEAFVKSFKDFGESSVVLVKAIGTLFTKPSTWKDTGGIIAVAFETTGVLQNFGFAKFLYVWAFISVNLAIFNLLPFPGLDGWQLLVTFIEAGTRKKIPDKVKNIVSLIGLGLLLLLMGVILIKDVFTYFFVVML